jgi:hypothetical protein
MTERSPAEIAASVNRALWGEVSDSLRSVQFRAVGDRIELRFFFEGNPGDDDQEALGFVGAEVAADFADATVSEEAVSTALESDIPCRDGWHTAYARREATLART